MYGCSKTYGHDRGLSCAFRQWRAPSHCSKLHGYALAFEFHFEAETLDAYNWVLDFGSMKPVKAFLEREFDHTLAVAADDPQREVLASLGAFGIGLADVRVFDHVGCEAFAEHAGRFVEDWLLEQHAKDRLPRTDSVRLMRCTVREHAGNAAWWEPVR